VDGNVSRVLARLGAIRGDIRESQRWHALQDSADSYLDPDSPATESSGDGIGATICTPKSPQCLLCPIAQFAKAANWHRGILARKAEEASEC